MASVFTGGKFRVLDASGTPVNNAKVNTYEAATTTPKSTYTTRVGDVPNANPVRTNSAGICTIFLGAGVTRFVVTDANDVALPDGDFEVSSVTETASLSASSGSSLIGFIGDGANAVARTVQDKLRETVSVMDFGTGTNLAARLAIAVADGYTSIYVPTRTDWVWTTVLTLPELWRGRIFGDFGYGTQGTRILAATGHNYPMIDAQGTLFVEIDGLHVVADDTDDAAPACFIVFARMLSGASSSNHRISRCVIEGQFFYCCLYNVGGEELVFEKNYWSIYGTANTITAKTACIVHQLSEDSYYSAIVTKEARTNGTSTSAIQHRGDVVKNQQDTGGSAIYVGPNCNDILFDLAYGTTATASAFLTLDGYFDGIRLGVERVECDKTARIVHAPNDVTAGSVSLLKGAYRRTGTADATKYAIDIAGTTATSASVYVAPDVAWLGTFGGGVEDIYLLRSTRKTQVDASFLIGSVAETLTDTRVAITQMFCSRLTMGKSTNLTVTTFTYSNELHFYYDPESDLQAHDFRGGLKVSGRPMSVNGVVGAYHAADSTLDTVANGIHWYFYNPNGVVGSISSVGSGTTFATSSDYRLKAGIVDVDKDAALAAVMSWRIRSFTWKGDGLADVGVVAHELQSVKPSAVVGEKDAAVSQGVDYSKLVPELVAAVQQLAGRVSALEA